MGERRRALEGRDIMDNLEGCVEGLGGALTVRSAVEGGVSRGRFGVWGLELGVKGLRGWV